jgi:hypothetical protein
MCAAHEAGKNRQPLAESRSMVDAAPSADLTISAE